ncbi:MAG: tRNA (N6-threonylcarbamoyladenosine(37)-N6)-methyltransferase TrmO [Candidatus Hermodarchaeota archaeon]
MVSKKIELEPIGIVHSPLKSLGRNPVQPSFSEVEGTIEILEKFVAGLKDLEGFEYIICLCYLHLVKNPVPLQSTTHWDNEKHGIFAIRSQWRPNPIGFSILKLMGVEKNVLKVKNLDIIDQTPVLDIKPFIPPIDNRETEKIGWIRGKF